MFVVLYAKLSTNISRPAVGMFGQIADDPQYRGSLAFVYLRT